MKSLQRWLWGIGLALLWSIPVQAVEEAELLEPLQAFSLEVSAQSTDTLRVQWTIAEGYYLYRERLRFESLSPAIRLGEPRFPAGEIKNDAFFGQMEIYRGKLAVAIPILALATLPERLELKISSQGCADAGVCYPPQTQTAAVALPAPAKLDLAAALTSLPSRTSNLKQDRILEADQAFILSITAPDPNTLRARWDIAEGYYLYRDKLRIEPVENPSVHIARIDLPSGEVKQDEFFGQQEVLYRQAIATAYLEPRSAADPPAFKVKASYQGCAEIGICYPPISKIIDVRRPGTAGETAPGPEPVLEAEQDQVAKLLTEKRFWALPAFFGFGLLLAFTPCVFPMIPILSSLIAGQNTLNERRAFLLSLVYVLTMALTYTLAGILAAMLGQNIQALFQNPWILISFSALFVVLALSMFGFYNLQLPGRWQSRLSELSNRQPSGSYLGVAVMGLLSALIVSPCVAPPLIGVLTVIAATASDSVLGGAALFVMSLGMGMPLLAIGTSAGRLMPKAGHWMDRIKAVFGVLLLGMAIWILERILPVEISMLLWAILLIVSATYMGALQSLGHGVPAWRTLIKGLGVVLLIYGVLLLVGVAAGGRDTLQPLRGILPASFGLADQILATPFKTIKTTADLDQALAQSRGRPVMLDFYADWCAACRELEKYTFTDPGVQATLSELVLLRADVTANDAADQALLRRFGVIGPPALLFFGSGGRELKTHRIVGFVPAERFRNHLKRILQLG